MKKLFSYIFLLAIIGVSGFFIYQKTLSPCDQPIRYGIGRFDTQFGLSENDFKSYITEVSSVWENVLNQKVFIYDENASFKINLIYDERQLATVQKQKTEFGLSQVEETFQKLDASFNVFKSTYDQKAASYEKDLAAFQSRKATYDATVTSWNHRGGAPKDQYASLNAERQYLNNQTQNLNAEAADINNMTKQLNTLLDERNAKAEEYNRVAEDYNKKYSSGLEFNQAEYIGGKGINVYQFGNKKDLVLALAHELGHALGMNHVENPKSIMYYLTGANTQTDLTPSTEDLAELNRVCPDAPK